MSSKPKVLAAKSALPKSLMIHKLPTGHESSPKVVPGLFVPHAVHPPSGFCQEVLPETSFSRFLCLNLEDYEIPEFSQSCLAFDRVQVQARSGCIVTKIDFSL